MKPFRRSCRQKFYQAIESCRDSRESTRDAAGTSGALHYLVHTYDFPPLADRGLSAARLYGEVAPSAPHALHMPSHIYSMLGMWQD